MNFTIYINDKKLNSNDETAISEYTKRLNAYCKPVVQKQKCSQEQLEAFLHNLKLPEHSMIYQIHTGSDSPSSEQLAALIQENSLHGSSNIYFLIGYDTYTMTKEHLSGDTLTQAQAGSTISESKLRNDIPIKPLSLSSMSMSNGLTCVVLCEQLYRSYRILNHQPYHK